MDRESGLQVEHLDREISSLRTTLAQLPQTENGTFDFALLHQKRELENKIQQQRTFLHLLLQGQSRPWHFHRLPLEILVEIFQWVTNPADQLQLLRTFPILGPLMHWDESVLIFKQIYPLIGHYLWEDWRNLWRLCQVRREFMDVVLDHLKSVLSGMFDRRYDSILEETDTERMFTDLVDECDRLGRTEWMSNNMPFLVWPHFRLEAAEPVDGTSVGRIPEYIHKFLDAHGEKVWICEIRLSTSAALYSGNKAQAVINDIIRRTPNLVVLYCNGFEGLRHEPIPPAPRPWPRLPHLRFLKVTWSDHFVTGLIRQYSAQLTRLTSPRIPENGSRFPRLEYYCAQTFVVAVQDVLPQSILESPLKFLHLELTEPDQTSGILATLAPFGNSLEVLHIYATFGGTQYGGPWDFRNAIQLPKLRHLKLWGNGRVRELDWLLALPSLQTLELRRQVNENCTGLLHLSKSPDSVSTNMWQHLQNLTRMDVGWTTNFGLWSITKNRYTRAEHEASLTGK